MALSEDDDPFGFGDLEAGVWAAAPPNSSGNNPICMAVSEDDIFRFDDLEDAVQAAPRPNIVVHNESLVQNPDAPLSARRQGLRNCRRRTVDVHAERAVSEVLAEPKRKSNTPHLGHLLFAVPSKYKTVPAPLLLTLPSD